VTVASDAASGPRRFSLGDSLIIVAALAIRINVLQSADWFQSLPRNLSATWRAISQFAGWSAWPAGLSGRDWACFVAHQFIRPFVVPLCGSCLIGLMVMQPLLRLRQPRPPLEVIARQPGFVICLAGNYALFILWMWMGEPDGMLAHDREFLELALRSGTRGGGIVYLLWPLLGLAPWRAERSWIDRLGRAVGWGWIIAMSVEAGFEAMIEL
jgi:hypothetical protein